MCLFLSYFSYPTLNFVLITSLLLFIALTHLYVSLNNLAIIYLYLSVSIHSPSIYPSIHPFFELYVYRICYMSLSFNFYSLFRRVISWHYYLIFHIIPKIKEMYYTHLKQRIWGTVKLGTCHIIWEDTGQILL